MRIQLYDRGTSSGKQLFSRLETVCKTLQIDYDPEYIKDMSRLYSQGIQGNTILLVNGETILIDKYPSESELTNILQDYL